MWNDFLFGLFGFTIIISSLKISNFRLWTDRYNNNKKQFYFCVHHEKSLFGQKTSVLFDEFLIRAENPGCKGQLGYLKNNFPVPPIKNLFIIHYTTQTIRHYYLHVISVGVCKIENRLANMTIYANVIRKCLTQQIVRSVFKFDQIKSGPRLTYVTVVTYFIDRWKKVWTTL